MRDFGRAGGAVLIGIVVLYVLDLLVLGWLTSFPSLARLDEAAQLDEGAAALEQIKLARVYEGLSSWAMTSVIIVAGILILWFGLALLRVRRTFGPKGQSSGRPAWIGIAVLYLVVTAALYFWFVTPMALTNDFNRIAYYMLIGLITLFGGIVIWIASIFGIGPALRPSVPVGARFS